VDAGNPELKNPASSARWSTRRHRRRRAGRRHAPGQHEFWLAAKNRPAITYVGSDDGMLHAFYSKDVTVGGVAHEAGEEAFAYIPPSMLTVIERLYAQNGQVADPRQHIYGLASSPKIRNLCVSNCNDTNNAVWKTLMIMTEGFGGNGMFMMNVTDPTASPPFQLMWTSKTQSSGVHLRLAPRTDRLGAGVRRPAEHRQRRHAP
jgi:Tfp pilus tip-associated adhesin PilY1